MMIGNAAIFQTRKNTMIKLRLLFLLSVFLLVISGTNAETSESRLSLGTLHNPPLEYEEDGVATGALVDIITEVVKRTGRETLITLLPWKRAQMDVKTGNADGCFNTGITNSRKEWAYFHEEILVEEQYVLFYRKSTPVRIPIDMQDVGHLNVGTQRGYAYGGMFQKSLDAHRFKSIQEGETIAQNVNKLLAKRFDIFVGDRLPTLYHLRQAGVQDQVGIIKDTTGQELIISVWPTYLAFSKKTIPFEYVKAFNNVLIQIKQDGTYERIFEKYTQHP